MEPKMRHLEMIQGVISRMANNSFTLKGWAVTLVAGVFTLSGSSIGTNYLIIFIPIIIFWGLDAFYLSKERSYRALYKHVSCLDQKGIDFNMDASAFSYGKNKVWRCMLSPTELLFYLPLSVLSAAIIMIII